MISNKTVLLIILISNLTAFAFAQNAKIETPSSKDKYSNYVRQLENGDLAIDYTDFRNSFLDSRQYSMKGSNYTDLRKQIYAEINKKDYQEAIKLTKSMLSIDYTSMLAHYYSHRIYGMLGDTTNQKKHQTIELGLLESIIKSGDGTTCETGWHVTQIEEEYYILNVMGAQLQKQSISNSNKNKCDKMVVKTDKGESQTYYFEANKVFEMENKLFGN